MTRPAPVSLVNTFNGSHVISRHRTIEAAQSADRRLQRATKKYNGQHCWIPTRIDVAYPCGLSREYYSSVIVAGSFAAACEKLTALLPADLLDEGHWGWVEDLDGVRFTVGDADADDAEAEAEAEVCGYPIERDLSGVGHCWRRLPATHLHDLVRQVIEGEIVDGGQQSGVVDVGGVRYRW